MRQLLVQVPCGCGKAVLDIAKSYDEMNLAQFEANGSDGPLDLVLFMSLIGRVEGCWESCNLFRSFRLIRRGHSSAATA